MKYQIDQSGKIEQTNKNTVIAFSNGKQRAVLITRKVKRQIQENFRKRGFTKIFIYQLFSIGIYFLIKGFKHEETFIIDLEYPGKDKIIYEMLHELLSSHNKPDHEFRFAKIGNRPRAHYAAKNVFDGKKKAEKILTFEEVMKATKKADGRLRGCFSTLVGVQPRPIKKR